MARVRCAIYTRKSSEDGLEQDFNSLDAQREACAAFIASQKAEGWVLLPEHYNDGGLSGGTLERPALQRLMHDLEAGRVDQIVVYKIDRLTRSLADFAKLVERLDAAGASFVSVTQSFNTATSMGRLTLNVLLSFAQFEREVTAERIRDKIAASKRRGLWMGGLVPFGYDADGRTLKIRADEAAVVRQLFELYRRLGTVRTVHAEAQRLGFKSRVRVLASGKTVGGGSFSRGHIYQMLSNPLYAGRIRHKRLVHDGQHPAIIAPDLWAAVQAGLADNAARERGRGNGGERSPFAGKLFDETGDRLTPSHANTRGVRHRYYVSHRLVRPGATPDPSGWRLPARALEQAILQMLVAMFRDPVFPVSIGVDLTASEIVRVRDALAALANQLAGGETDAVYRASVLVQRAVIAAGSLTLVFDPPALSAALGLPANRLQPEQLHLIHPLRLRRRGVETRLVLGEPARELDHALIRNLARANEWMAAVQEGRSFNEIAATAGTSKLRVQHMIHLAFLAPDIVDHIVQGVQPLALTSDWLKMHGLPPCWQAQRRLIAGVNHR
jgi:site-specific DNA recombinase